MESWGYLSVGLKGKGGLGVGNGERLFAQIGKTQTRSHRG